jgi:hypothetical protein
MKKNVGAENDRVRYLSEDENCEFADVRAGFNVFDDLHTEFFLNLQLH